MAKTRMVYFNYHKIIVFLIVLLLVFQITEPYLNVIFAASPSIVRQEIIDDENDWQPWKIKNE
jgi:hypothetical protein